MAAYVRGIRDHWPHDKDLRRPRSSTGRVICLRSDDLAGDPRATVAVRPGDFPALLENLTILYYNEHGPIRPFVTVTCSKAS